jgi:hypothetical protein
MPAYFDRQLDEEVEFNTTLSLTPRLIAVTSEKAEPETVSTVFLPARGRTWQNLRDRQPANQKTAEGNC